MPTLTQEQIINGLSFVGHQWSDPVITFSIPQPGSTWGGLTLGFHLFFDATQADGFRHAVESWASVIAVPVVETDDLTSPGDIRGLFDDLGETIAGLAHIPPLIGTPAAPLDGTVLIDYTSAGTASFSPEGDAYGNRYQLLLHEIGHALGLKHPFDGPDVIDGDTRYTVLAYRGEQNELFTYSRDATSGQVLETVHTVGATGPLIYDILAAQAKYGANPNTGAGDDAYTFDPSKAYFTAIYDAGGVDLIDLHGHERPSLIDLTPGSLSSIDYYSLDEQEAYWTSQLPDGAAFLHFAFSIHKRGSEAYTWSNNAGIAFGTWIENVSAGEANDTIVGNAAANTISGNGGEDVISGGEGDDRFIWRVGDGSDTIDGGAGVDRQFVTAGEDANFVIVSARADHVALSAGTAALDQTAVEELNFQKSSGPVTFAIGDLSDTPVRGVNVNLAGPDAHPDEQADSVIVSSYVGVTRDHQVQVFATGTGLQVLDASNGAVQTINIDGIDSRDHLSVNEGDGNNLIVVAASVTSDITINTGGGADTLSGGSGNDFLYGGGGSDHLLGEDGADSFIWIAGDGSDSVDGGAGFDRQFVTTFDGADSIVVSADTGHAVVSADGATLDLTGVEEIDVQASGGTANIEIVGLGVTAVGTVNINLTGELNNVVVRVGEASGHILSLVNNGSGLSIVDDDLNGARSTTNVLGAVADNHIVIDGRGERIELVGFGDHSYDDLLANGHLVQTGNDVLLTDGVHTIVTLQGVTLSSLTASDFLFG